MVVRGEARKEESMEETKLTTNSLSDSSTERPSLYSYRGRTLESSHGPRSTGGALDLLLEEGNVLLTVLSSPLNRSPYSFRQLSTNSTSLNLTNVDTMDLNQQDAQEGYH